MLSCFFAFFAETNAFSLTLNNKNQYSKLENMADHDYLTESLAEDVAEEIEVDNTLLDKDNVLSKEDNGSLDLTPIKKKRAKRSKSQDGHAKEDTVNAILQAVHLLTQKMDDQTQRFIRFEKKIEENAVAIEKNKNDITELQTKISQLKKENVTLKNACEEHARYKRRWNLRLLGLPEKDDENVRETVIGILTRIIPVSVDQLRFTVDTVHRLGIKRNAGTSSGQHRAVIIQFALRTVKEDVWIKWRDAKVCKDLHIIFKQDFSKEDRLAREKLYPLVQNARKSGLRAFLKEGYALIDNKRVYPPN